MPEDEGTCGSSPTDRSMPEEEGTFWSSPTRTLKLDDDWHIDIGSPTGGQESGGVEVYESICRGEKILIKKQRDHVSRCCSHWKWQWERSNMSDTRGCILKEYIWWNWERLLRKISRGFFASRALDHFVALRIPKSTSLGSMSNCIRHSTP